MLWPSRGPVAGAHQRPPPETPSVRASACPARRRSAARCRMIADERERLVSRRVTKRQGLPATSDEFERCRRQRCLVADEVPAPRWQQGPPPPFGRRPVKQRDEFPNPAWKSGMNCHIHRGSGFPSCDEMPHSSRANIRHGAAFSTRARSNVRGLAETGGSSRGSDAGRSIGPAGRIIPATRERGPRMYEMQGPRLVDQRKLADCPSEWSAGAIGFTQALVVLPPVQDTRKSSGCPVLSRSPSRLWVVPVFAGREVLRLIQAAHKTFQGLISRFFCYPPGCPPNELSSPQNSELSTAVIHSQAVSRLMAR